MTSAANNTELVLHHYTEDVYLEYAVATVKGRALAQVQDGLKPVQRRILHTMKQLGLSGTAKPVKSARVVGDVLGKYHPHGDQAAYDAMVRMAQDFTLRYPLILGQGNFGSRDGDSAAAMRYTEAKLTPIAELLLQELGQGTVDFQANYDGTLQEPVLLPARLPMLLLNGTMGIAVGMAADIPPHNLREVVSAAIEIVKDPSTSIDKVLEHIQGPDFPEGAQLVSLPQEVKQVYTNGRGSLRSRASWVKEDLARGQWQVVITNLPYQVSTRQILEELDSLTNPQPSAGKKAINQQQANAKQLALDFLEKAIDESDKDNRIRLVLAPRNSKVDLDQMMAFLLANTSLEVNVSVNITVVGLDGKPQPKNLMALLQEWAQYRVDTVRRRTEWELDGALKRIHILEGRHLVFVSLDKVIETLRNAEDPKEALISRFGLSDVQAEDILEMRLRQLNRLEGFKLEKELEQLHKEAEALRELLESEKMMRNLVVKEMTADAQKFGDDRRTLINPQEKVSSVSLAPKVLDEPVTITISKNLWVKAYRGTSLPDETFQFKAPDSLLFKVETTTTKLVWVLDSKGRAYSLDASSVPVTRGEGVPLSTLVEIQAGAVPSSVISGSGDDTYLFAGSGGYGYVSTLKNLTARQKSGKAFLVVDDAEKVLPPVRVPSEKSYVLALSSVNRLLVFDTAEVKVLPNGGKGVMLIALDDNASLESLQITASPQLEVLTPSSGKKKEKVDSFTGDAWTKLVSRRGRKGLALEPGATFTLNAINPESA